MVSVVVTAAVVVVTGHPGTPVPADWSHEFMAGMLHTNLRLRLQFLSSHVPSDFILKMQFWVVPVSFG